MANMTVTTAMSVAPSTTDRGSLITAIDAVLSAVDTAVTNGVSGTTQVYTVAISGSPTGGTYSITISSAEIASQTITLAYNAAASAVQTALRALLGQHLDGTTVTATGTTPNFTHTITFKGVRGDVTLTADNSGLTGGTSPATAVTETTAFTAQPRLTAASANVLKQHLVDWAEDLANSMK